MTEHRMPLNRLAGEISPYLLQHARNPVDWYPWGPEALGRARREDQPILLSIGYAACHWCHVMAHESFEDPRTAALLNRHFISIKVDREERPDLDSIYMDAVHALTGQGGWPLNVFLTPNGLPFYGGTYFPPEPRYGMPSFRQLLESVADAWRNRRADIVEGADRVVHVVTSRPAADGAGPPALLLPDAAARLAALFDERRGGFGDAPKFPPSMAVEFLLAYHRRSRDATALRMAESTLDAMARGGIRDQLGGGFARYATDAAWLVPHFEKMLYDNALLARAYLHAWQHTGRPAYRLVASETLDFLLRELRLPEGGFACSLDADSEGGEGRHYIWTADEIRRELGAGADGFMRWYGVTDEGNWEGRNILHVALSGEPPAELQAARERLFRARERRVRPRRDDKVVSAWNGLAIAAFAEAGRALDRADFTRAAADAAGFLRAALRDDNGRLRRTWRAGRAAPHPGLLEDQACVADGLLALHEATRDAAWLDQARELADVILGRFGDPAGPGFYDVADDHEPLFKRPRNPQDHPLPSGGAMACHVLLKLAGLTGETAWAQRAAAAVAALGRLPADHPTGFAHWLCAALALAPTDA